MKPHVKNELRALLPMMLGVILMGALCLYFSNQEIIAPFYSLLLIGFGLVIVVGLWFRKSLFFVLGILLSTPVYSLYLLFVS